MLPVAPKQHHTGATNSVPGTALSLTPWLAKFKFFWCTVWVCAYMFVLFDVRARVQALKNHHDSVLPVAPKQHHTGATNSVPGTGLSLTPCLIKLKLVWFTYSCNLIGVLGSSGTKASGSYWNLVVQVQSTTNVSVCESEHINWNWVCCSFVVLLRCNCPCQVVQGFYY